MKELWWQARGCRSRLVASPQSGKALSLRCQSQAASTKALHEWAVVLETALPEEKGGFFLTSRGECVSLADKIRSLNSSLSSFCRAPGTLMDNFCLQNFRDR